jgi:hypothetical protein
MVGFRAAIAIEAGLYPAVGVVWEKEMHLWQSGAGHNDTETLKVDIICSIQEDP